MLQYQISWKSFQWTRLDLCGRVDGSTDRQSDMMKLTVAFRNVRKLLKSVTIYHALAYAKEVHETRITNLLLIK
jgi:hypothetical protein